ncbi:mucin-associated surface protein (MASP) [Trypanosoma cruzi]|nr:mucin-associated surface protein (MASP) [Trypanosoma cruzi]
MYEVRVIMMIVLCFVCFRCPDVCFMLLLPVSANCHASRTHSYAQHGDNCLCGHTFEDRCMRTGAIRYSFFSFLFLLCQIYWCLFALVLFLLFLCFSCCLLAAELCVCLRFLPFH